MKNISFLLLILLTFCILFFSSCKKEENALSNKEKIVGKWKYDYIQTEDYQQGVFIKSEKETVSNNAIEFKADETYYIYYVENEEYTKIDEGTWRTYGSNTIILDEALSQDSQFDIKELSSTKFTIFIKSEITIREESYERELEISYKR